MGNQFQEKDYFSDSDSKYLDEKLEYYSEFSFLFVSLPKKEQLMLARFYSSLDKILPQNRVLIIYGSRRVGKTFLLNQLLQSSNYKYKIDSGDNLRIKDVLSSEDFNRLFEYAQGFELIAIDEAQEIPNIGKGLKILIDNLPDLKLIATGSSSFDLSQKVGEPLTGRKRVLNLFPLAQGELLLQQNAYALKESLPEFLIFGSYPEVLTSKSRQEKIEILDELIGSYLLKDILSLENIKNPKVLFNLLKLLSFQIGNLVSINELAKQLQVDGKTVSRYLDLLEKTFILFKVRSFSSNPRKEITKKSKYYFFDNGIRNGLIMQFGDLSNRNDIGPLWENFMVSELYKRNSYLKLFQQFYFWRNYNGQEIDLVVEKDGNLELIEFKWTKDTGRLPRDFEKKYGVKPLTIINQYNYLDFLKLEK